MFSIKTTTAQQDDFEISKTALVLNANLFQALSKLGIRCVFYYSKFYSSDTLQIFDVCVGLLSVCLEKNSYTLSQFQYHEISKRWRKSPILASLSPPLG